MAARGTMTSNHMQRDTFPSNHKDGQSCKTVNERKLNGNARMHAPNNWHNNTLNGSEDYEALPEEFRPKVSGQHLLTIETKPQEHVSNHKDELKIEKEKEASHTVSDRSKVSEKKSRNNAKKKQTTHSAKSNLFFANVDSQKTTFSNSNAQRKSCFKNSRQANPEKRNRNLQVTFSKMSISLSQETLNGNTNDVPDLIKVKSKVVHYNEFDSPWYQIEPAEAWKFATKKRESRKCNQNELSKANVPSADVKKQIKWMNNLHTGPREIDQTVFDSNCRENYKDPFLYGKKFSNREKNLQNSSRLDRDGYEKIEYRTSGHARKNISRQQDRNGAAKHKMFTPKNRNTRGLGSYKNNQFGRDSERQRQANTGIVEIRHEITIGHANIETTTRVKEVERGNQYERNSKSKTAHNNVKSHEDFQAFRWNARSQRIPISNIQRSFSPQPDNWNNKNIKQISDTTKSRCKNKEAFSCEPLTTYPQEISDQFSVVEEEEAQSNILLIHYGEDISDAIVGSFTAMNIFKAFYKEWKEMRDKTVLLLEELLKTLSNSHNQESTMKDVIQTIGTGAKVIAIVPNVQIALVARIVGALSDVFLKLFNSSPTLKSAGVNDFELMLCLEQDIEATSIMYMYGLQCDQQFQETCKLIEMFHRNIQDINFKGSVKNLETEFLKEMSGLNPNNHVVYYRRLQKWMDRFRDDDASDLCRAFSRSLKDWPEAVEIVTSLAWRFHEKSYDGALHGWEEICQLLQNENSLPVQDILPNIRSSLSVLLKERTSLGRGVSSLLKHEKQ